MIPLWKHTFTGNSFTVWEKKYFIKNMYGKMLIQIEPKVENVAKLHKVAWNEYIITKGNKWYYIKIEDNFITITE